MSEFDIILRAGRVLTDEGLLVRDLGIHDGKITGIGQVLFGSTRADVDVSDYFILPGPIDSQVCLNTSAGEARSAYATGSSALAAGGVTSFFELPFYSAEPVVCPASFDATAASITRHASLDFGLWAGITEDHLVDMAALHEKGVIGFAARMAPGVGGLPPVDDCILHEAMIRAVELGQIVGVLAENGSFPAHLMPEDPGAREYILAHPVLAEMEAVQRAILLAYETGCSLHFFSISSPRSLELIANARTQGVDVSCSVAAHHLFFNDDNAIEAGLSLKTEPVLRDEEDRNIMTDQFQEGVIDIFSSAHTRIPLAQQTDWLNTMPGIEGGEAALRMLLGMNDAESAARVVARTFCENVARRFLLHPAKGAISHGADADLVVIDPNIQPIIEPYGLHSPCLPYLGRRAGGVVLYTFTRGVCVYGRGKFNELEPKQIRPFK